jgi:hypothetical protein
LEMTNRLHIVSSVQWLDVPSGKWFPWFKTQLCSLYLGVCLMSSAGNWYLEHGWQKHVKICWCLANYLSLAKLAITYLHKTLLPLAIGGCCQNCCTYFVSE